MAGAGRGAPARRGRSMFDVVPSTGDHTTASLPCLNLYSSMARSGSKAALHTFRQVPYRTGKADNPDPWKHCLKLSGLEP